MWRTCTIDRVPISFSDIGSGPPVVFVHGVYVTAAVWNDVIAALGGRVRCIAPTWPLGAHEPAPPGADLSAAATARRVIEMLAALDLHDVTLVANDTGGALVLAALGDPDLDISRIGALVLTNCDSYEHFPPRNFKPLTWLCRRAPRLAAGALHLLASSMGQRFFLSQTCARAVSPTRRTEVFGAFAQNRRTRRQAVAVTGTLNPGLTLRAAPAIRRFSKPVTLVWGDDDAMFPMSHAVRLAREFPAATLIAVPASSTYVMLDAPQLLADAILAAATG